MSAATRVPVIATIVAASSAAVALSALPQTRDYIAAALSSSPALKYGWRLALLGLALVNLKNMPGFWHIRVLRGIVYQLFVQRATQRPSELFAPLVTESYNSLYDTDYNLHKSNSTYFADLDVARAHFVACLIRTGLRRLNAGDEDGLAPETRRTAGSYTIALGAVVCFFHRQIEPLQGFEIYTRLLAWDRKWVYCVSHLVVKGKLRPRRYAFQPWKKGRAGKEEEGSSSSSSAAAMTAEERSKLIFATSVARYVFKKGRLTINPEVVLERSRLLPQKPQGVGLPPRAEAGWVGADVEREMPHTHADADADAHETTGDGDGGEWTWAKMERERLKGLRIANHMELLGAAQGELRADEVLGKFGDYW